jgi:hypothetical protein
MLFRGNGRLLNFEMQSQAENTRALTKPAASENNCAVHIFGRLDEQQPP